MLGILGSAVVNTAACHDDNIAVLSDEKVVVDDFLEAALVQDDGNMDAFVFGARLDLDVDTGAILLGDDINVRGGIADGEFAVRTDIDGTFRHLVEVGDFHQQSFLDLIYFFYFQHVFSPFVGLAQQFIWISGFCRPRLPRECRSGQGGSPLWGRWHRSVHP